MPAAKPIPALHSYFEVSLIGMMSCAFLAVAISGRLDLPTMIVASAAIVLRALTACGWLRFNWSSLFVGIATIAYIGFFPLDVVYVSGEFLPATVHLVFFLASLLLLRAQSARDVFFLNLIALLEIMAGSLFAEGIGYVFFLAAFLIFSIAVMMGSEIRASFTSGSRAANFGVQGMGKRLAVLSGAVFTGVLVIGGVMFVALPRTARIALQNFIPQRYHLPGFSNEVRLGQIGEILQSSQTVMHVKSRRAADVVGLRLRGTALAEFDGKRWFNRTNVAKPVKIDESGFAGVGYKHEGRTGRNVEFEIQLMDTTGDTLFLPGLPEHLYLKSPFVLRTEVDGFRTGMGWARGLRYRAFSFIEDQPPVARLAYAFLPDAERLRYLQTPAMDPRIDALAKDLTAGATRDSDKAAAMEQRLKTDYGYTMDLPASVPADPVADFLFQRRKGHCEYFASSMALMLRTIGVPSRVVNGFVAGEINTLSGWGIVRASDAHSWVEAWIDGDGWRVYDPTPQARELRETGLWMEARNFLDAAEVFYQNWVVGYDMERQLALADRLNQTGRGLSFDWSVSWSQWKARGIAVASSRVLYTLVAGLFAAGALIYFGPWLIRRWVGRRHRVRLSRGDVRASDATVLYERLVVLLRRKGFERPAWMTPVEFMKSMPSSEDVPLVEEFTVCYNRLRFGGHAEAAPRMLDLLEALDTNRSR
jgi:hypothetical protein